LNLPLFNELGINNFQINSEDLKSTVINLINRVNDRLEIHIIEALVTLLDFYQPDLSVDKIHKVWSDLKQTILNLPFSEKALTVFHADARCVPLPNSSVNLVITSPPYINVFNYHQQYRASMEALNWDLLKIAKSEIGSNRKHRSNRFLTVIQYCLDITQSFQELTRICHPTARLIFVVGRESRVRGTPFGNGEIVVEIATRGLGFSLTMKQERVFQNRFGKDIYEDILHFSLPTDTDQENRNMLETSRQISKDILEAAYHLAPDEAKRDIESAIGHISKVCPSPIFNLHKALE
jgi:hypothetical protein